MSRILLGTRFTCPGGSAELLPLRSRILLVTLFAVICGGPAAAQTAAPVLDRAVFFGEPAISGAQLSPDGRFISFRQPYQGVMHVWVKAIDEPLDAARPLTSGSLPVANYFWTRDSRRVLFLQDLPEGAGSHLYSVDPSGTRDPETGVPQGRNLTPVANVQAIVYSVPVSDPTNIIIGLNERTPYNHDAYRLNLVTGERTLLFRNNRRLMGFHVDRDGRLRLAARILPDGDTEILRVDEDEELAPVYRCNSLELCQPLQFHPDGRRVYLLTNRGDDVDLARLVLFDPETGEEVLVEEDPEGQADFGGAVFSEQSGALIGTYYVGDRLRIYPQDVTFSGDLAVIRSKLPDGEIYFGGQTSDGQLQLISLQRDVDPGSIYLYDRRSRSVSLVFRSRPDIVSEHLAPVQEIRYRARDGVEIPAYLTVPQGVQAEHLPVVVYVHGGPWDRVTWGYDAYVQFLANRGYAVLQPNFRGSTGYGKGFLNAGNRQWGRGVMQHDVTDGVRHLIDEGIADPERVAIFGMAYGGYAALAGLAFTPDLYAAGISYAGPANLATLLEAAPAGFERIKRLLDLRVGNPEMPSEEERLISQSPLYFTGEIESPLLLIHRLGDPGIKKEESDRIAATLQGRDIPVDYLVEGDASGSGGRESGLAIATAMEQFLARHLGGRQQTSVPSPVARRLGAMRSAGKGGPDSGDASTGASGSAAERAEPPAHGAADELMPLPDRDGSRIESGITRYRSVMEAGGQQLEMHMSREIRPASYRSREVWRIIETTRMQGGVQVDTFDVDRRNLLPVRRHAWGTGTIQLQYEERRVHGEISGGGQSIPVDVRHEAPIFGDSPGLDLALMGLPLRPGYTTVIQTFDPVGQRVRTYELAVERAERITVPAGTFETFVVTLMPEDQGASGTATLHIKASAPYDIVRGSYRLGGGVVTTELVE
jgi:dipeptidyl aminopeptidase/acylaminoacyl peptidase